jgi:hypothetical protein
MNNATGILTTLDEHLDHPVRLSFRFAQMNLKQ